MSFAKVYSAQNTLTRAQTVNIEIDITSKTLHAFSIVGLPDKAVEESKDRVSAAIGNTNRTPPKSKNQKIVVALAPADLKKEGPIFDFGIAVSYLLASEEVFFNPENKLFIGELSLDGYLKPVNGVLAIALEAEKEGFKEIFVPKENAKEAALVKNITVYGVSRLQYAMEHLEQEEGEKEVYKSLSPQPSTKIPLKRRNSEISLDDIKGQESAKRGIEIAAAGGHNLGLSGPPGTGKTLLAKAFASLLPSLSFEKTLEVTAIHSSAGILDETLITKPPFRAPHHTASHTALVGGGNNPRPGEITLAHKGALFLDEFPEFDRRVIEALRQPLEEKYISISRSQGSVTFPADISLIAAMNPCPCGNYGTDKECTCTPYNIIRYRRKISGPVVDRIDIWLEVPRISYEALSESNSSTEEEKFAIERIDKAREFQRQRHLKNLNNTKKTNTEINAHLTSREVNKLIEHNTDAVNTLNQAAEKMGLSPRGYHKVIKIARTIADLEEEANIKEAHVLEALQYRPQTDQK